MSFERFLDLEKVKEDVPDIDSDFQHDRRDEVINFIGDEFGWDNVTQVCNWGRLKEPSAFKKACTALAVDFGMATRISKWIQTIELEEKHDTARLEHLFSLEGVPEQYHDTLNMPGLRELSLKFFNRVSQPGTHAAAVLITPPGLLQEIDHQAKSSGTWVNGFSYGEHRVVGLVKNDVLGIRNLTTLQYARKLVWDRHG